MSNQNSTSQTLFPLDGQAHHRGEPVEMTEDDMEAILNANPDLREKVVAVIDELTGDDDFDPYDAAEYWMKRAHIAEAALSHPEPVAQEAVALVWADEGELAIEWPGRAIISIEGGGIVSFATCDGEKWSPGKVNPFDRPADAAEQINAALRARVAELEARATPQAGTGADVEQSQ